jgi:DNA-binding GntR family transcriptional regulator
VTVPQSGADRSAEQPPEPARERLRFARVEQPRAHEFVAEQLRREIALGIIQPGSRLPSERDLAQLFGVSRITVQQAVNLLESEGLVWARRGRGGGTFVTDASLSSTADSRQYWGNGSHRAARGAVSRRCAARVSRASAR